MIRQLRAKSRDFIHRGKDFLLNALAAGLDLVRFFRHHGGAMSGAQEATRADLTRAYHALEKGMALKDPRTNFGIKQRERLFELLHMYIGRWGYDELTRTAFGVLESYCIFNEDRGAPVPDVRSRIIALAARAPDGNGCKHMGGTIDLRSEEVVRNGRGSFRDLLRSRHSVRQFSEEAVDPSLIRQAVEMAMRTPSACNRQAWRVYAFSDPDQKRAILQAQGGGRGFGEQAPILLVVASDFRCFFGTAERHQAWVDGGLFAMSLMYALQFLGLGSCPLHCSFGPRGENRFRRAAGIPSYEPLIVAIAVGHMPERFKVAASPRRSLDEVLIRKSIDDVLVMDEQLSSVARDVALVETGAVALP